MVNVIKFRTPVSDKMALYTSLFLSELSFYAFVSQNTCGMANSDTEEV